jgi:hypothetical protein
MEAGDPNDAKDVYAKLLEKALEGDIAAIREFLDRTMGKPGPADIEGGQTADDYARAFAAYELAKRSLPGA